MPAIILDFDPPLPDAPGFCGGQADLVHFLSFAYAARFGATHELSLLAHALQTDSKINLKPLLNFADREVEEAVDQEPLDLAWQDPLPLAECCEAVVGAFAANGRQFTEVLGLYPALKDRIDDLGHIARSAARQGSRVRVTYLLNGGP